MSDPFLGEVKLFAFDFPPRGWATCDGQILSIAQNQALFAILGTTYGGNGQTTFALPDLRGRAPVHFSSSIPLGTLGGEATHTLTIQEMPVHTHAAEGSSQAGGISPAGNFWGSQSVNPYAGTPNTMMSPGAVSTAGGSQAHDNRQPYLVTNFCIALQGIFPSRN
jgi:microcystin-dependent protein